MEILPILITVIINNKKTGFFFQEMTAGIEYGDREHVYCLHINCPRIVQGTLGYPFLTYVYSYGRELPWEYLYFRKGYPIAF